MREKENSYTKYSANLPLLKIEDTNNFIYTSVTL